MTHQIINIIKTNSPHLSWIENGLIYLVRHGSRAYNCHTETSDDDYKGICIPPKQYYFGNLNKFEQAELKDPNPDTVIFEIKKFFSLAVQANPNVLETLFVDENDRLYVSALGQEILDNRELFLSKKIYHTMKGYAYAQMKRLTSHRGWLLNPLKEAPKRSDFGLPELPEIPKQQLDSIKALLKKKLDKFDFNFLDQLTNDQRIGIKEIVSDIVGEMKISLDDKWLGACRQIGLNDNLIEIMKLEREFENAQNHWNAYLSWKKNRNPKRYEIESKVGYDTKHFYHVIRLFLMCEEVLSTGKLIVKRPDREMFMDIRSGKWKYEDLMDFAEKKNIVCEDLYKNSTTIPHIPNHKKIDELCIKLVEKGINLHDKQF